MDVRFCVRSEHKAEKGLSEKCPEPDLASSSTHRRRAAALGVAEPFILGDGFRPRMDPREIRALLAEVRDQPPTQMALYPPSRLRIPPVDKLRFIGPSC